MKIIDSDIEGWDVIHSYSREQAIADGVLIDVTSTAAEAGFKIPVALTSAVYEDCVRWDALDEWAAGQDEAGRLWDVLWVAITAAHRQRQDTSRVEFDILRIPRYGAVRGLSQVRLSMVVGPGDQGEPVITIMQPGED